MHVISFVTQKGGSRQKHPRRLDRRRRLRARQARVRARARSPGNAERLDRKPPGRRPAPISSGLTRRALDKAISTLADSGYDLTVIDTPGVDSPAANAAMRAADLCLIPCRPTATDLRGCLPTVQSMMRLDKPFAFVLAQCPPRSPRVDETRAGLAALGLIAEPPIVSRTDHQDAMAAGQGVTEFNPSGAAATEIRALWGWIEKKLDSEGRRNAKAA